MSTEPIWRIEQTEAQFQAAVQQLASLQGWEWMHIQRAMNDRTRWRTPVTGSLGAGWPDLVLVKGKRLLFVELKAQKGKPTGLQDHVLQVLGATNAEVYVWRPSDWDLIVEVLGGSVGEEREHIQEPVSPLQALPPER